MTAHAPPAIVVCDAANHFYRRLGATVRAKVMCAWPAGRR